LDLIHQVLSPRDDNGDVSACNPPEPGKEVTTFDPNAPIYLAFRGSCTFTQKARNAQAYGAGALVVINTKDGPAENMPAGNAAMNSLKIPVCIVMISNTLTMHSRHSLCYTLTRW
jgi:hypothetical protein